MSISNRPGGIPCGGTSFRSSNNDSVLSAVGCVAEIMKWIRDEMSLKEE